MEDRTYVFYANTIMPIIQEKFALYLLGVIQGMSEVLPISSTGHLALVQRFFSISQFSLSQAAGLHLGSALAIFVWFFDDWRKLWHSWVSSLKDLRENIKGRKFAIKFHTSNHYTPYFLALSLLPVAVEGFFLQKKADQVFSSGYFAPIFLILNAGVLVFAATRTRGERMLQEITWYEGLIIGAIQGIAVLPGISRLGLVLCTGLWLGLNWKEAIRLAFILAVPVIVGAFLLKSPDLVSLFQDWMSILSFLVAITLTFTFSMVGLKFLTSRVLERKTLKFFSIYCLTIGLFFLVYLIFWRSSL